MQLDLDQIENRLWEIRRRGASPTETDRADLNRIELELKAYQPVAEDQLRVDNLLLFIEEIRQWNEFIAQDHIWDPAIWLPDVGTQPAQMPSLTREGLGLTPEQLEVKRSIVRLRESLHDEIAIWEDEWIAIVEEKYRREGRSIFFARYGFIPTTVNKARVKVEAGYMRKLLNDHHGDLMNQFNLNPLLVDQQFVNNWLVEFRRLITERIQDAETRMEKWTTWYETWFPLVNIINFFNQIFYMHVFKILGTIVVAVLSPATNIGALIRTKLLPTRLKKVEGLAEYFAKSDLPGHKYAAEAYKTKAALLRSETLLGMLQRGGKVKEPMLPFVLPKVGWATHVGKWLGPQYPAWLSQIRKGLAVVPMTDALSTVLNDLETQLKAEYPAIIREVFGDPQVKLDQLAEQTGTEEMETAEAKVQEYIDQKHDLLQRAVEERVAQLVDQYDFDQFAEEPIPVDIEAIQKEHIVEIEYTWIDQMVSTLSMILQSQVYAEALHVIWEAQALAKTAPTDEHRYWAEGMIAHAIAYAQAIRAAQEAEE